MTFTVHDAEPASGFTLHDAQPQQPRPSVAMDVAKSVATSPLRAASGLAALPQVAADWLERGVGRVADFLTGSEPGSSVQNARAMRREYSTQLGRDLENVNAGQVARAGFDAASQAATGAPVYDPQTGPGRIADFTGQVLSTGPGAVTSRGVAQGLSMGLSGGSAGEFVRQFVGDNPYAVGATQLVGTLAGGAPFAARGTVATNAERALQNVTPQQLQAAQSLMDDAAARGVRLTGAEAIAQVTGRNNLQNIQRVVEQSREGGPIMEAALNARPAQVRTMFDNEMGNIAPQPAAPAATPVALQQAAQGAITDARQAGNRAAAPYYAAAENSPIPGHDWNTAISNPAVREAMQAVRGSARWGVTNEAPGSLRWLDAAKRWIDDKLVDARPSEARIWNDARAALLDATRTVPEYATARQIVAQNRQQVVNPMQASPVGDIARTVNLPAEQAMQAQAQILAPAAPRALDPNTIRETARVIGRQDPDVLRQWTRQNLEGIFAESSQNLMSGVHQAGGAKFATAIAGNPRQQANLQALISSSTGSNETWVGFRRMLDIMEAEGKRMPAGSMTEFNRQISSDLARAGAGAVAAGAASPGRLSTAVWDAYQRFRYGQNSAEMARILTDPESVRLLNRLARTNPDDAAARLLVGSIVTAGQPSQRDDAK